MTSLALFGLSSSPYFVSLILATYFVSWVTLLSKFHPYSCMTFIDNKISCRGLILSIKTLHIIVFICEYMSISFTYVLKITCASSYIWNAMPMTLSSYRNIYFWILCMFISLWYILALLPWIWYKLSLSICVMHAQTWTFSMPSILTT